MTKKIVSDKLSGKYCKSIFFAIRRAIISQHFLPHFPHQAEIIESKGHRAPVIRSMGRLKSVSIQIRSDGIEIRAPLFFPLQKIQQFFESKIPWIEKKLAGKTSRSSDSLTPGIEGKSFFYLGTPYLLKLTSNPDLLGLFEQSLCLPLLPHFSSSMTEEEKQVFIYQQLVVWYRSEAERLFSDRVSFYSQMMNVSVRSITVGDYSTQWGSCSFKKGTLRFNWRLIMAPLWVLDYLVVHELCHFKHPNHSAAFWSEVGRILPDYKIARAWLKNYGLSLSLPLERFS